MVQVVLFDFFGTLVQYEANRTALKYPDTHNLLCEWGFADSHDDFVVMWDAASQEIDAGTASSYREPSMVDYAVAFCDKADLYLSVDQHSELARTFVAEWATAIQPIYGAGELLQSLASRYRLGIVSNTNDTDLVPSFVAEHFSPELFEHVVLSVEHGFRKPHPMIYEAALNAFEVEPNEVVFVGDTHEADYLGPRIMGMEAFLIDPEQNHSIPNKYRLASILDLDEALETIAGQH